ncbi:MAG: hypothetical protein L0206_15900 [Actinobacteria bacterium]|nr:hypothetical protein [Actinomycetota bacterium]
MAYTIQLREDGSGGNENPWATDLDAVAVAIGNQGSVGATTDIQILNSRIELKTASGVRQHAIGAASDFANGVVRAKVSISHAGSADNNQAGIELRAAGAGSATGIQAALAATGASAWELQLRKSIAFVASVAKTILANVLYELVLNAYDIDKVRAVMFDVGAFPPGLDHDSIAWDLDRAGGDGFPSSPGKVGVYSQRNVSAQTTHVVDDALAFSSGSPDVGTVAVTSGDQKVTVAWTDVASAAQKRATAWYFLRYKEGSQPADSADGTLVTGNGTGLGGSAIRADGRFLDDPANFDITGLVNGTAYFVRPFCVMWDGTIVAGTSQSATPAVPGAGAPTPPTDLTAVYSPAPHVAGRVDLAWTNPSIAGDYRINYRTDGTNPTSATDASATLAQDWTAYNALSAGSKSVTALTDGTRVRFAVWHRDTGLTVNTGAFVQKVPVDDIESVGRSPADGATGLQPNPFLIWDTEAGEAEAAKPVHYFLEVSTSETDEAAFLAGRVFTISSLDDGPAGFEFETSTDVWAAIPATGLAATDVGKRVRFRFPINVIGQLFWRVSAQQPVS